MIALAIGSNVEPLKNILQALQLLKTHVKILNVSFFYESDAIGIENSPRFVNGACLISTPMNLEELKSVCKKIEAQLGRKHTADKNAPRPIDLDLLVFENCVDPLVYKRSFLSVPLAEISPSFILPETGVSIGVLAAQHGQASLELLKDFSLRLKQESVQ